MVAMINSIGGIIIWTEKPRFSEMMRFYSGTLGLDIHSKRSDFVVFRWLDMRLSIGVHSKVVAKNTDPRESW